MKHFILIVFMLICLLPSALSVTPITAGRSYRATIQGDTTMVSGLITENTTWTFEGSPYVVADNIIVDLGVFLTIEPGVTVKFTNDTNLIIDGHLTAQGNATHKILFTSNNTTPARGDWDTIYIREYSSATSLEHIEMEYASTALTVAVECNITDSSFQHNSGNAISIQSPRNIYIRNVRATNNTGTGITVRGQNITTENIQTSENGDGIRISGTYLYIKNVTTTGNTYSGLRLGGESAIAEIYYANVSANSGSGVLDGIGWQGRLSIFNSSITHNGGTGLSNVGFGSYVIVRDSILINNTIGVTSGVRSYPIDLEKCEIIGHREHGISTYDWGQIDLNNCLVIDNTLDGFHVGGFGSGVAVRNSNISNNGNGIWLAWEGNAMAGVRNSTIQGNQEYGVLLGDCKLGLSNSIVEDNPYGGIYGEWSGRATGTITASGSKIVNNTIGVLANSITASSTVIANNSLVNVQGGTCTMEYCKIHDGLAGVQASAGSVNFCNIYNHTNYDIENKACNDINATYNWWSTTNETLIQEHIYDYYDNYSLGRVLYKPYLEATVESYPVASFIYEPSEPVVNESILFNASSSYDMDGTIISYIWDFGDGNNATESDPITNHAYQNPGNYTVKLTVTDNDGLNHTTTETFSVGKINGSISISASPTLIMIGYYTRISGSIVPKREGVDVTVWYRLWGVESWSLLRNVTTNQDSEYSSDWTPLEARTFQLKANWTGDEYTLPAETSLVNVFCLKIATHISISTSCPSTYIGFKVNITGTLQDTFENALKNKTVVLYYTFSGAGTWTPITSDSTNYNGVYSALWIPPATGYFILKAEWAGNSTHRSANDTTKLSSLPYLDQYVFTVESNSSISELAFNTTDWTLSFDAAGPNGTKGYVKITIAKSLVSDIANMKVYIDSIQTTNFSATSTDDSWLLTFNYSHSTHQVLVDLDINIIPEYSSIFPLLFIMATLLMVIVRAKKGT